MANQKKSKQVHVMYDKESKSWYAKQDNATRKSFTGEQTQSGAINRAKAIAKNNHQELSIHRKDNNQIREKNSYGNDEFPPRG